MKKFIFSILFFLVTYCTFAQNAIAFSDPRKTAVSWLSVGHLFVPADARKNIMTLNMDIAEIDGESLYKVPVLKITSIDGQRVRTNTNDIIAISAGIHMIEVCAVGNGNRRSEALTIEYTFPENGYFEMRGFGGSLEGFHMMNLDKYKLTGLKILDLTEPVKHGVSVQGFPYNAFLSAEKKLRVTFLQRTIDGTRAKSGRDVDNLGVFDLTVNPNQLVTLEIPFDLIVYEFNGSFVTWGERRTTTWIRIPPGNHTLVFYYDWQQEKLDGSLVSSIAGIVRLAQARSTDNIKLTYNFFPGASYEFKSERDRNIKGGNVARVIAIPGKGAPKKQERGIGSTLAELNTSNTNAQPAINQSVKYSVSINDTPTGPYTIDELKLLAQRGELTKDSLVWKEGMPQWAKAGTIPELNGVFLAVPPPLPPR